MCSVLCRYIQVWSGRCLWNMWAWCLVAEVCLNPSIEEIQSAINGGAVVLWWKFFCSPEAMCTFLRNLKGSRISRTFQKDHVFSTQTRHIWNQGCTEMFQDDRGRDLGATATRCGFTNDLSGLGYRDDPQKCPAAQVQCQRQKTRFLSSPTFRYNCCWIPICHQ